MKDGRLILFCLCFLLFACNSHDKTRVDGSEIKTEEATRKQITSATRGDNLMLKRQITGVWFERGDSVVAAFRFDKDSVYNPDQFKYFKYIVTSDDSLIIYYDGYVSRNKATVVNDTMILKDESVHYYIRNRR